MRDRPVAHTPGVLYLTGVMVNETTVVLEQVENDFLTVTALV
jgi:hypothetical protein